IVYVVVVAGDTLRVGVVVVTPSLHVIANGAVPVSVAVIVVDAPAQIVALPLTTAVGFAFTVTTALPVDVPLQFASEMLAIVYVVVDDGETLRVGVVVVTPSLHVIENGAVPVSVAVIVVDAPAQIAALPLTTAVGFALTVTTALPVEVPLQFASEMLVIVYVVVVAGDTLRVGVVVVTPSLHVIENGALPVSVAVTVEEPPAQIVALPLTTAVGFALTVTTALPVAAPLQFASVMLVIVYVVVEDGDTVRVGVVVVTPSLHVIENGAVPVSVALIVAEPPAQTVALPLTTAVGFAFTVTTAL